MSFFRVRALYAQPNHKLQAPNNAVLTSTHANVTVKVTVNLFRDCNYSTQFDDGTIPLVRGK